MTLSRRMFVAAGLALFAPYGNSNHYSSAACGSGDSISQHRLMHEFVFQFLPSTRKGCDVGAKFLGQLPKSKVNASDLWLLAFGDRIHADQICGGDMQGACERLLERHRTDLLYGNLEFVDGWALSRTEANLYALAEKLTRDCPGRCAITSISMARHLGCDLTTR